MSQRENITIRQGGTFTKTTHWYGGGKVVKEIDDVTVGCPTGIKVTAHGLPAGEQTPVFIDHVKGAYSLNDKDENLATYVDADNFTVDTHTRNESYVANTGCLVHYLPKDLTNWTARMQIREDIQDTTAIVTLVSPTDITIDTATAKITITITADTTEALDFDSGVYDLELIDASGAVTPLLYGDVVFIREVTKN